MITRLSHLCLGTRNLPRLIEFYTNGLGCQVVHEFINPAGELYGVFLSLGGGSFLEIFNDPTLEPQGGPFRHFCFQVDSREEVDSRLAALSLSSEWVRGRSDRTLQCWTSDPDGNKIEFHFYDPESIQFSYIPV